MPAVEVSAPRRQTAARRAPPPSLPADLPAVAASPVFACGYWAEARRRGADRSASPRAGAAPASDPPPPRWALPAAARRVVAPEPSPTAPGTVAPLSASTPAAAAPASDPPPARSALPATQSEPRPGYPLGVRSVASHPMAPAIG